MVLTSLSDAAVTSATRSRRWRVRPPRVCGTRTWPGCRRRSTRAAVRPAPTITCRAATPACRATRAGPAPWPPCCLSPSRAPAPSSECEGRQSGGIGVVLCFSSREVKMMMFFFQWFVMIYPRGYDVTWVPPTHGTHVTEGIEECCEGYNTF